MNYRMFILDYDTNATYEFIDGDFFSTVIYINNDSLEKTVEKTVEKSSVKGSVKGSVKIIDLLVKNHNISAFELAQKIGSGLVEKVGSRLAEKVGGKLGENQMKILLLIEENPKISKKRMSEILKISTTAIDKNINKLKSKNLLKRIGPDKGGYWEVIDNQH